MVNIKPFRGYLYNTALTGGISRVIAPPWDIIDDREEAGLLGSSEWNVIRLISQKLDPSQADGVFLKWISGRILVEDSSPAFYFLKHTFSYMGKSYERKGIFGLLQIEDFSRGNIIPHENVFEKNHENRYRLIEKCLANFSPVFMLYQDAKDAIGRIVEKAPVMMEGEMKGDSLEFGRIDSRRDIEEITGVLSPGKLFIADGHHRYQAAFRFYMDNPGDKNSRVLVFLANIESTGLMILPTHRYIAGNVSFAGKKEVFEKYFHVEKSGGLEDMSARMESGRQGHSFGVYEKGDFHVITLKPGDIPFDPAGPGDHSKEWLSLDNVILKNLVIDRILGAGEREVIFNASAQAILDEYSRRNEGVVFFVNPVSKESFLKISMNGEKMPQKSTYFYPKVPTGFVIHRF